MIHVEPQPEPPEFSAKVRAPGRKFLHDTPNPSTWDGREYWTEVLNDLYEAYGRVCAYAAHWIPRPTGEPTVDHFVPKSVVPSLAYEWTNYRLASLAMNRRKSIHQDVLDPFAIGDAWFVLDFESFLLKPNPELPDHLKERITKTIDRLRLNDDNCTDLRLTYAQVYVESGNLASLRRFAPLVARELERQGLLASISSHVTSRVALDQA